MLKHSCCDKLNIITSHQLVSCNCPVERKVGVLSKFNVTSYIVRNHVVSPQNIKNFTVFLPYLSHSQSDLDGVYSKVDFSVHTI